VFLDVGFKCFLEQHGRYIRVNEPVGVELNPRRKQYVFACSGIKNNLLGQLSAFIGGKIFDEMGLALTPALASQLLDFPRLNAELEEVMAPVLKQRKYLCFNFCKYVPLPTDSSSSLHILLFLFGEALPVRARLVLESNSAEMCKQKEYV
jgi:hypothetical protein